MYDERQVLMDDRAHSLLLQSGRRWKELYIHPTHRYFEVIPRQMSRQGPQSTLNWKWSTRVEARLEVTLEAPLPKSA